MVVEQRYLPYVLRESHRQLSAGVDISEQYVADGFKDTCADLVDEFRKKLGNTDCSELVKIYKKDDVRCLETVCLAADVFEEFYNTLIVESEK